MSGGGAADPLAPPPGYVPANYYDVNIAWKRWGNFATTVKKNGVISPSARIKLCVFREVLEDYQYHPKAITKYDILRYLIHYEYFEQHHPVLKIFCSTLPVKICPTNVLLNFLLWPIIASTGMILWFIFVVDLILLRFIYQYKTQKR